MPATLPAHGPHRLLRVAATLLAVTALAVGPLAVATTAHPTSGGGAAAVQSASECTTVVHDAFRTDNQTIAAAVNGSATATMSNTQVTIAQNAAFVRLRAQNPNGYCVRFVVEIDSRIVPPAELGTVEAENDSRNVTASWHAVADYQQDETYTRVVFTLGPAGEVLFAPTKARVTTLQWTQEANQTATGVIEQLNDLFDDDATLKQRRYFLSPENASTQYITVRLQNTTTGKEIQSWQAVYRLPGEDWKAIDQDSEAPVFYRRINGGDAIQFVFNNKNATVRFTANPTWSEQAQHDVATYWGGIDTLTDWLGGDDDQEGNG